MSLNTLGEARFAKMFPIATGLLLLTFLVLAAFPGRAEQYPRNLGTARLFTNDLIGDGHDRWRSGSYFVSVLKSASGQESKHSNHRVLELRLRTEILSPWAPQSAAGADRPYGFLFGLGAFRYLNASGSQLRYGAQIDTISSTGNIQDIHSDVHSFLGLSAPFFGTAFLREKAYLTVSGEYSRSFQGGNYKLRPFIEAQVGIEDFARVGLDFVIGPLHDEVNLVRDVTTGHLVPATRSWRDPGFSFVMGADIAHMFDSQLFSSGSLARLETYRYRFRIGVDSNSANLKTFFGLTYLSEEFDQQLEGQTVGSITATFNF